MNYKDKYKQEVLEKLTPTDKFDQITAKLNINNAQQNKRYMKKGLVFATSGVCLALVLGVGTYLLVDHLNNGNTQVPTTYQSSALVKMNLNPSITFVLDEENKVVTVTGENEEGKMIIAGEAIVGKTLEEAIQIVLQIQSETGYLVSGNATIDANNLTFSINVDDENYQQAIKDTLNNTVSSLCDELNINETIVINEESIEQLKEQVKQYDFTLTDEQIASMDYEELVDVVETYSIETAALYSEELEELYNQVKEYEFKLVESQYTKDMVSQIGGLYQIAYQAYITLYDSVYPQLQEAIDYLNEVRYEYFVNEESEYQKALGELKLAKENVLKYRQDLANVEETDEETKAQIQSILDQKLLVLNEKEELLNQIKESIIGENGVIEGALSVIETIMASLDDTLSKLPSQETIEAKLNENIATLESSLNTRKDELFAEFETKYAEDIEKAKQEALAYKESLKNSNSQESN